jgi:hypothetical protein
MRDMPERDTMPVTRRKSNDELPESLRHDADAGPVVMPGYTVLSERDWDRLLDDRLGKIAWGRRNDPVTATWDPVTATWDEVRKKHGL